MCPPEDNIHTGHRRRMRDKIFSTGVDGMADHEILEFLLFYAIPKRDVNPLAHRLLDLFGSLSRVLNASAEELMAVEGVGVNVARVLTACGAALRDCLLEEAMPVLRFVSPENAVDIARARYVHPTRQEMAVLCAAENGLLLNCVVRDWDIIFTAEGARWCLEAAMDNRAHHLTLVWKRHGRARRLTRDELEALNRLLVLFGAAEIYLSDMILLYHDGQISLRRSGVLSDSRLCAGPSAENAALSAENP